MCKLVWYFILSLLAVCPALAEEPVSAKLVARDTHLQPGIPSEIALVLTLAEGWHIYGSAPEASGIGFPTSIQWQNLDQGVTLGPPQWPSPQEFDFPKMGICIHGYAHEVIVPMRIVATGPGPISLRATVSWLACSNACIPGNEVVALTLPIEASEAAPNSDAFKYFPPRCAVVEKTAFSLSLLILAWIGGIILNGMPCVFPVLGLKILGFVQQSAERPWRIRLHGLVFSAGTVLSICAIGGGLLLLRAYGQAVGWGFQLQNPIIVATLIIVMVVMALQFMGVFELGGSLIGSGQGLARKEGYTSSFFSGVLAVIVATPCTAPFMGSALGAALVIPAPQAMLIFAMLGAGMATPYLILSFSPKLVRSLPKPGVWMETFKQALSFPLLLTAVWLLWVFTLQTNVAAMARLGYGLVIISLGCWIYGRWCPIFAVNKVRIIGAIFTALCWGLGLTLTYQAAHKPTSLLPARSLNWETWSPERVKELRSKGRWVLVDFTAAWCLTCQANKYVFENEQVIERLQAMHVALLEADWTNQDPLITRALESFSRSGVPTNVIYTPDGRTLLLPQLLTASNVLDTLK